MKLVPAKLKNTEIGSSLLDALVWVDRDWQPPKPGAVPVVHCVEGVVGYFVGLRQSSA